MTVSNSTWGSRQFRTFDSRASAHALGGDIGQGLAMGIGTAIGVAATGSGKTTFYLAGDGDFILNLGELTTTVQERVNLVIVLMSGKSYGVVKNIQDAQYGGRRHYVDLHTPNCAALAQSLRLRHRHVSNLADVGSTLKEAASGENPLLMEIDILSIGSFKTIFADPSVNQQAKDGRGERTAACATNDTTVVA